MPRRNPEETIEDAIEKIKSLIVQERWHDAHRACLEVLRFDPENIRIIRLKNKIEKNVRDINRKAIKEDIRRLKVLWEDKKYKELMHNLKKLKPYINEYPSLKKFYVKTQKEYKKTLILEQEEEYEKGLREIKSKIAKNDYTDAMKIISLLSKLDIHQKDIEKLRNKIKQDWIDYELLANKKLQKSNKYEDIILFYQRLLRIDGKSKKVKDLLDKTKKEYDLYKIDQKRDIIYKELVKLRTLMQLKKFESALEVSRALLDMDPRNKEAKSIFVKSKRKVDKKINDSVLNQMKTASKKIKEEYKENKEDFIKL